MIARVAGALSAALLIGGAATAADLPDGTYRETCRNAQLSGGVLSAACKTGDGRWRDSAIRIAACPGQRFENNHGTLICDRTGAAASDTRPAGTYLASCRNVGRDGALLRAMQGSRRQLVRQHDRPASLQRRHRQSRRQARLPGEAIAPLR